MLQEFNLNNFQYDLPAELIAQEPVSPRSSSRLLVINKKEQSFKEHQFNDVLSFLKAGDVLVLNDTRVINARLFARRQTGGKLEVLLLKEQNLGIWEALVKPAKRAKVGEILIFAEGKFTAEVLDVTAQGGRVLKFSRRDILSFLEKDGKTPTPPYIKKEVKNTYDYQTVYAAKDGAIAAPTAGLHFTDELLNKIKEKGVDIVYVTLHCGLATFWPVKTDDVRDHPMAEERVEVSEMAARKINAAKKNKGRVVAVGSTCVRSLESAAVIEKDGKYIVSPFNGETSLYIVPGYTFKIVDCLITNFHVPFSTNLILVSCFAGNDLIIRSYEYARDQKFRFYSFGDAVFIH